MMLLAENRKLPRLYSPVAGIWHTLCFKTQFLHLSLFQKVHDWQDAAPAFFFGMILMQLLLLGGRWRLLNQTANLSPVLGHLCLRWRRCVLEQGIVKGQVCEHFNLCRSRQFIRKGFCGWQAEAIKSDFAGFQLSGLPSLNKRRKRFGNLRKSNIIDENMANVLVSLVWHNLVRDSTYKAGFWRPIIMAERWWWQLVC